MDCHCQLFATHCQLLIPLVTGDGPWFIDSGASTHMAHDNRPLNRRKRLFLVMITVSKRWEPVQNNCVSEDSGDPGKVGAFTVESVWYVPELRKNLLSVGMLASKGFVIKFIDNKCAISTKYSSVVVARGIQESPKCISSTKLYRLVESQHVALAAETEMNMIQIWHKILGHISHRSIRAMSSQNTVDPRLLNVDKNERGEFCIGCAKGKLNKLPRNRAASPRAPSAIDLIYSDVCGPMPTETPSRRLYFLSFIDDHSQFAFVLMQRHKAEAFEKFKEFEAL